jgi:hypothetical protein
MKRNDIRFFIARDVETCFSCGKLIQKGDMLVSMPNPYQANKRVFLHRNCFNESKGKLVKYLEVEVKKGRFVLVS